MKCPLGDPLGSIKHAYGSCPEKRNGYMLFTG